MSFGLPYEFVNDREIVDLIGKPSELLVVDVRDEDFLDTQGGNIKGAKNVPSRSFLDGVHNLVKESEEIPKVVFHCALSQVRGPKSARIYAETRKNLLPDAKPQEIYVLRGGFTQFQAKYGDQSALVENYRKELWEC
ncbi:Rhodanese-like protein [Wallemia mellicola]|nr:Rhodanese-like protein [Wallemia mellicola]